MFLFSLVSVFSISVFSFILICSSCMRRKLCMCAMLKFEDHFWTEFTIDMENLIHTMFDAR